MEQRRVGAVQILGLGLAQRPAAEADDAAAPVVDREGHPMPEAVVARPVLRLHEQARLERRLLGIALGLERALEAGALGRRVAQAEAQNCRVVEPAALKVGGRFRPLRALQPPGEPARRRLVDGVERPVDRRRARAGAIGRRQPGQLGQAGDRRRELQALDRHDEVDRVAVLAAAEAVIEALGLGDRERGRLFLVERTQAQVLAAAPGQADVPPDQLDQRQARLELVERDGALISHRSAEGRRPADAARGFRPLVELGGRSL